MKYIINLLKISLISLITGVCGGIIGSLFHKAVEWATEIRHANSYLIYLLPLSGLLIALIYRALRLKKDPGTNGVLCAARGEAEVPLTLGPSIFFGTIITHLFGGSAGREGAALQLGGTIGSLFSRALRLDRKIKPIIILSGMSAVFSALFGTPVTAVIFSIEVCLVGSICHSALVPCLVSSYAGFFISTLFGNHPVRLEILQVPTADIKTIIMTLVLGVACGLLGIVFCKTMKGVHSFAENKIENTYLRAFVGGIVIVALTMLLGTKDYNGAGMDVVERAMKGQVIPYAFLLKIIFTSITIGFGFKGGEIVPTIFIGSTFGCFLGGLLGLPASFGAGVGVAALFAAVTNCPLASLVLGIEVFGGGGFALFAAAIFVSTAISGYTSLYKEQRFTFSKEIYETIDKKAD